MDLQYTELNRGNLEFEYGSFRNPERYFTPAYTWNWVSPISRGLIDTEISNMRRAGIRCLYILPFPLQFRPFFMRSDLKPYYLSEEYYDLIRYAWEKAHEAGMAVWYYDEGGFPSGNLTGRIVACDPKTAYRELDGRLFYLKAKTAYRRCEDVITARLEKNNKCVNDGDKFDQDETIIEYYALTTFNPYSGCSVTNAIEPETTQLFIKMGYEEHYRRLSDLMGGQVQIAFTDEPRAGSHPWRDGIDELFRSRFGYDVLDHLPAILNDHQAKDISDQIARIDYLTLVGELFRECYMLPLRCWCREHGMLFTGHLDHDDRVKGAANCGYGSFLHTLRQFDLPGIDVIWRQISSPDQIYLPDKNNPFFDRLAGSAAHQNGTNLSLSESFAIYGAGLTGDQMRYIINHQLARGINLFNIMSVQSGRDRAMGLTMRPCFTLEYPGYEHLNAINDYIARASRLMQSGRPDVETALYMPARDFLADSDTEHAAMTAYEERGARLEADGIDFDLIDDNSILQARLEKGALFLGNAVYKKVYTPECKFMPENVREKINKMLDYEPLPVVCTDCKALRARKRVLTDGGSIYFIYNESAEFIKAEVGFCDVLPVTELDLTNGDAICPGREDMRVDCGHTFINLQLESGESRAFLFSKEICPHSYIKSEPVRTWAISQFEISKKASFEIDMAGIRRDIIDNDFFVARLGAWKEYFGDGFSGEVVYRSRVDLGIRPDQQAWFILDLGHAEYSAKVMINGQVIGYSAFKPLRIKFDSNKIPENGQFILDIEIANTASNRITQYKDMEKWPPFEIGAYWKKTLIEERETCGGGLFGPVTLSMYLLSTVIK